MVGSSDGKGTPVFRPAPLREAQRKPRFAARTKARGRPGTPVFTPAPRPQAAKLPSPTAKKRTGGLDRRPPASSRGGGRHRPAQRSETGYFPVSANGPKTLDIGSWGFVRSRICPSRGLVSVPRSQVFAHFLAQGDPALGGNGQRDGDGAASSRTQSIIAFPSFRCRLTLSFQSLRPTHGISDTPCSRSLRLAPRRPETPSRHGTWGA